MLTYLINVTDDLLAFAVVLGVIFSLIDRYCSERGRIVFRGFVAIGAIVAGVRAYITNTRRLVGSWRVGTYGYLVTLILLLLTFAAFAVLLHRMSVGKKGAAVSEVIISSLTGLLTVGYLYSFLPTVYVYPFKFDVNGSGISKYLSTDFLYRLGGYLLGLLICLVALLSAYHVLGVLFKKGHKSLMVVTFVLMNVLMGINFFARLMSVFTTRKIVDSVFLFRVASFCNNHSQWYTYLAFAIILVLSVILLICSKTAKEPYATKAEHRKQRAVWRSGKRYSGAAAVCFVLAILCTTWFVKLNTEVIVEAPMEDPIIVQDGSGADEELRIPLEMVSDGHLHRFGYTTEDGVVTRLIVILKQENTNNYGVGLDACEICGEAGYFENSDGQVVCKKCNVRMNTSTIGMKGGCNPIIIDYDINESYISVPVSEMVKNQSNFK